MLRIDQTALSFVPKEAIYKVTVEGSNMILWRLSGEKISLDTTQKKGAKGDAPAPLVGERGLSAHEYAVLQGKTTLLEREWLLSYKGERGDAAQAAPNGIKKPDGVDGDDIVWKAGTIRMISSDKTPKAYISKNGSEYTISLEIPESTAGADGRAGTAFKLGGGDISSKEEGLPEVSLKKVGDTYEISLSVVRGERGSMTEEIREPSDGENPVVDLVAEMIPGEYEPRVDYEVQGNHWLFKLYIPEGDKPGVGLRGAKGYIASEDVHYSPIKGAYSNINDPPAGGFFAIHFRLDGKRYFGWSVRQERDKGALIIQQAWAEDMSRRIIRSSKDPFSDITEGWLEIE